MRWLVPLALVCGAACHEAPSPPTCDQVGAHLHEVLSASLPAHEGLAIATEQAMAGQCRTSAYSDAVRRCLVGVTKPTEVAACRKLQPAAAGSGR